MSSQPAANVGRLYLERITSRGVGTPFSSPRGHWHYDVAGTSGECVAVQLQDAKPPTPHHFQSSPAAARPGRMKPFGRQYPGTLRVLLHGKPAMIIFRRATLIDPNMLSLEKLDFPSSTRRAGPTRVNVANHYCLNTGSKPHPPRWKSGHLGGYGYDCAQRSSGSATSSNSVCITADSKAPKKKSSTSARWANAPDQPCS